MAKEMMMSESEMKSAQAREELGELEARISMLEAEDIPQVEEDLKLERALGDRLEARGLPRTTCEEEYSRFLALCRGTLARLTARAEELRAQEGL